MEFRKAVEADVNNIMKIIKQAQEYFNKQGINQWQNNYPNVETILNDIANQNSYVLLKDNEIIATVAVYFDGEKTYDSIYDGEWISNEKYAVIHRMAVDSNYKGLGLSSLIIKNIEQICLSKDVHSIKIDTHEENLSMQKLLEKNNFQYCGIIYLEDKSKRIAFEKILYMKNAFYYNTRIGRIRIEENGISITKLYFVNKDFQEKIVEKKETKLLKEAIKQINEYLDGRRITFELPLALEGTEFQKKVWSELKKIPYGETRTYGEIAKNIENEKAARAVGMANNKNPILIIIPCHRVIGANGNLTGYAGGIDIKKKLLDLEQIKKTDF